MKEAMHQIFVTLDWIHREAQAAYWLHESDCGSDFNEAGECGDCQHYNMCLSSRHAQAGLDILKQLVGA